MFDKYVGGFAVDWIFVFIAGTATQQQAMLFVFSVFNMNTT